MLNFRIIVLRSGAVHPSEPTTIPPGELAASPRTSGGSSNRILIVGLVSAVVSKYRCSTWCECIHVVLKLLVIADLLRISPPMKLLFADNIIRLFVIRLN